MPNNQADLFIWSSNLIDVIPKKELLRAVKALMADKNRGITQDLFAELCGVDKRTIQYVFMEEKYPMTELVQRRVSKGYDAWRNGEIAVMERYGKKWIEWRKTPKMRMVRGYGLTVKDGQIKLDIGIKNRLDYSGYSLDDKLKGI